MGNKSIFLVTTVFLAVTLSMLAKRIDKTSKDSVYIFPVNGFIMARSTKRAERINEQAFIAENLFNNPQMLTIYPLSQARKKPFSDMYGNHLEPADISDVVPRADLVHSKGAVKDFYKFTYNPALNAKPSTVACVPSKLIKAVITPTTNFRYKFTTKAEDTIYGTIPYTCYVTPDNDVIRKLFDELPGSTDDKNIRVIGQ